MNCLLRREELNLRFLNESETALLRNFLDFKDGLVAIICDKKNFCSFSMHGVFSFCISSLHASNKSSFVDMMKTLQELARMNEVFRIVYADSLSEELRNWLLEIGFVETGSYASRERLFELVIDKG